MTNEQKMLLRDLSMNPVFGSLLEEIDSHSGLPRWKRSEDSTQQEFWIYRSGYTDGIEFVLKLMGYEHD